MKPLTILGVSLVAAAFLGQAGVLVALAGTIAAVLVYLHGRRRADRLLLAEYVDRNSFPGDSIGEFIESEAAAVSLAEARARMDAWRRGYVQAERDARRRRSEAARRRP